MNSIENSTADTLCDELQSCAIEHNLLDRMIGLVCDTENTNIGFYGGACVKFEMMTGKELLRLCCRHHIMELILKKVCYCLLGSNETPHFNFEGLELLKFQWEHLDKSDILPLGEEEFESSSILAALKSQAIEQLKRDSRQERVRDDYEEMNDICLKLLGIETNKKLRVIGASGKARWMAKAILIGKTFLLRHQLDLEPDTLEALRRICIFISTIYVKFWNRVASAVDAPANDLLLMQQLHVYRSYDREIAQVAINSFGEHLWYLGGELITLSLFSEHVSNATKNNIRHRFQENVSSRDESSIRFIIDGTVQFNSLSLEDFIQPRSNFIFQLLGMTPDFLHQDASTWDNTPSYIVAKNMIHETITVINDGAERFLGMADKTIRTQKARKENNFKNLIFSKFDRHSRR